MPRARIRLMRFDAKELQENELNLASKCPVPTKAPKKIFWIDIVGINDSKVVSEIGKCFNLHPLVVEDISSTRQRPKLEDYDDYLYMVVRMLSEHPQKNGIRSEQISLILGRNYVISFQEREGDVFNRVRESLRKGKGKIRNSGAGFLAYSLLDSVVDNYFTILEDFGEKVEKLEAGLMKNPDPSNLLRIRKLKKQMLILRRSVWPLRELLIGLERESRNKDALISKSTAIYLRDVYDHSVQVVETLEMYRDSVSGMVEIYLSAISNRMNEIMKVLTIIGTVFIPLTFITGLYGMNFEYMPELAHPLGYFLALGAMLVLALLMLLYFRRKGWL